MRAPSRKHPLRRVVCTTLSPYELDALSTAVKYVGSPEHKDAISFAGMPKPRADASICDRALGQNRKKVQRWLETAISCGSVGELLDGCFPRYVWYRDEEIVYEGRLVNRELGEYKGYPLDSDEWPQGLVS